MKKGIRSYITFTRKERFGLMGLCGLVLILLLVRVSLPYWLKPEVNADQEQKLQLAWEKFKRSQPKTDVNDTSGNIAKDYVDASDDNDTPLPITVDLNTADSATLVRFKGIGPSTAAKIVFWRKGHGRFTDINQLYEFRSFTKEAFEVLKKHLVILPDSNKANHNR